MMQHTYEERMLKICADVLGWERSDNRKKVCAFSVVHSNGEIYRVIRNWKRQNYHSKLVLVVDGNLKTEIESQSWTII